MYDVTHLITQIKLLKQNKIKNLVLHNANWGGEEGRRGEEEEGRRGLDVRVRSQKHSRKVTHMCVMSL